MALLTLFRQTARRVLFFCKTHPLFCAVALAVLLRFALFSIFPLPNEMGGDLPFNLHEARSFLLTGGFDALHLAPGWPLFLALWSAFFGTSASALFISQVFLGALLVLGVYLLGVSWFSRRAALFAAFLTALWPPFLIQTFLYGEDLLFYAVVLAGACWALSCAFLTRRFLYSAFAGVLFGFAALTEPIAFFLPLMVFAWVAAEYLYDRLTVRTESIVRVCVQTFVFLLCFAAVIAPWAYRNAAVFANAAAKGTAPLIEKNEQEFLRADILRLALDPFLSMRVDVLASGVKKLFLFPYPLSVLDQGAQFSYTAFAVAPRAQALGAREAAILFAKISITIAYWLLLFFAIQEVLARPGPFSRFVAFVFLYLIVAVISYGSLYRDNFESISLPSSFILPAFTLLIILAAANWSQKRENSMRILHDHNFLHER